MKKHIRALGTVSYKRMKIRIFNLAEEYPQIDLTIYIDDLEQGLVITQNNFRGDYDVVTFRGATTQMLRQHLTTPAIEIDISMYDILCAIKSANGLKEKTTVISFANIRNQVPSLCDLLECDMDIYIVGTVEAVGPTLRSLQEKQYHAILCDVIVNTAAQRLGVNSFLITSSVGSIRNAFYYTLLLCDSRQYLWDENLFSRELI